MKIVLDLLKKHQEIIAYLFWGVMTTIVSWGSYSFFALLFQGQQQNVHIFGLQMSMVVLISNVLSWICAFSFAFVTNKLWVFQSKSWQACDWIPEFGKFFSARVATGIMEILAVPLLVGIGLDQTILGIEGMVAKVLVSVLVVLLNYVFSKVFIFRNRI